MWYHRQILQMFNIAFKRIILDKVTFFSFTEYLALSFIFSFWTNTEQEQRSCKQQLHWHAVAAYLFFLLLYFHIFTNYYYYYYYYLFYKRSGQENDIKVNLKEAGCEGVNWMTLAQDRNQWQTPVNLVMNFQVL